MKYLETQNGTLHQGDAFQVLKSMDPETVDMCVTSPPYWGLRDYGTDGVIWDAGENCEHEWGNEVRAHTKNATQGSTEDKKWKAMAETQNGAGGCFCPQCSAWKGQLGLEPDFNLYIKHLCDVFDEVQRVLKKEGTVWINIGDTYFGGKGRSGYELPDECKNRKGHLQKPYQVPGYRDARPNDLPQGNLQPKSLMMIPFRLAIEMVDRGWILRNTLIWHKPNCMPSSVSDRFTVDFEYLFFFSKKKKYYFEQQFASYTEPMDRWGGKKKQINDHLKEGSPHTNAHRDREMRPNPNGRNKRTVWTIPTQGYKGAHFAVFPKDLVDTPIQAGCPKEVCVACGKPREIIFDIVGSVKASPFGGTAKRNGYGNPTYSGNTTQQVKRPSGYSNCGCGAGFAPGVVLDPFIGSGTTAEYCEEHGLSWQGIEISKDYCELIKKRLAIWEGQQRLVPVEVIN